MGGDVTVLGPNQQGVLLRRLASDVEDLLRPLAGDVDAGWQGPMAERFRHGVAAWRAATAQHAVALRSAAAAADEVAAIAGLAAMLPRLP